MRRALIPWLLFGLALVAIAVPIAQGTSSAKDPRVAGLIKKVNALTKRVAALETRSACIGVQGIAQFGIPAQQDGYLYKKAGDDVNLYVVTAIDFVGTGQTPQALMATVNPQCVTGSRTLYRVTGGAAHKSALYRATAR